MNCGKCKKKKRTGKFYENVNKILFCASVLCVFLGASAFHRARNIYVSVTIIFDYVAEALQNYTLAIKNTQESHIYMSESLF